MPIRQRRPGRKTPSRVTGASAPTVEIAAGATIVVAAMAVADGIAAGIVMGASARPGEELYFGNTANAVLQGTSLPLLILAS